MPGDRRPSDGKRDLRARLRSRRRALDPADVAASGRAVERLLDGSRARTVVGYLASEGEVPVDGILSAALLSGARVLLPRVRADRGLDLVELSAAAGPGDLAALVAGDLPPAFARGPGGIPEPKGPACEPEDLPLPAWVLVPSVALDLAGHRLGRGGGSYDRALGRLRRLGWRTIGVCHASHLLEALPREGHDEPVDAVLTEEGLLEVPRPGDPGGSTSSGRPRPRGEDGGSC